MYDIFQNQNRLNVFFFVQPLSVMQSFQLRRNKTLAAASQLFEYNGDAHLH